jgi:PAS domain S-box-containing protein
MSLEVEQLFQSLFQHMAEGVALHEVILDAAGKPVNYRILQVNAQYQPFTGLAAEQVIGKLATEAYGTSTPPYMEEFTSVGMGAPPHRFETYFAPFDRIYEISVAPLGPGYFATIFLDITERKRNEVALREHQWFLQASQRVGHVGSYRYNVANGTWICSPALNDVFGIDADFPRTTQSWLSLVHPDDCDLMAHHLAEHVIRDGGLFDHRYRITRRKDNAIRWVHGYGELEHDAEGRPTFMIGTILDITDLVAKEQALQAKTEELDKFFSLSIDLLSIASLDGRFLRMNAAWTSVLGWSLHELEGQSFMALVHPDDVAATEQAVQKLAVGQPVLNFTNRYRTKSGDYRSIEWRSTPGPGGMVYAAARDVTHRIEAERALRSSEERFRRTFELVPNPVSLSELGGTMIDCNRAFTRVTGYSREEVIGKKTADLGLWPDPEHRKQLAELMSRDGELRDVEVTLKRKDGKLRTAVFSGRLLELDGRAAMLMTAQDVTEQRLLEKQMLHTQKLESLGVLAGGIAHDFNNLLTGVLGNADLALLELSPVAPARECLTAISDSARRASELCRQLLAYSGKGRFLVQPVDMAELVQEMGHLLTVSISKKVVLKYHFSKNLPMVEADVTQMRQVIMNLIVNASEAIGERSGVISVTTGLASCDATYLAGCFATEQVVPGDFVYLEIADTGQGMDRTVLDRVFDPFFTTKFTGRGLGLPAVLGIVRGHGGAIRVYSEPGRGTTFRLLFPMAAVVPTRAPEKSGPNQPWKGSGHILVADDEETVRNLTRRMLERSGFSVTVASDGREALQIFEQNRQRFRLVVLDLTMPHVDGEACFRGLRQLEPNVKVVLSSGYNEQDVVNLFAGKGLAGFIQKPYTNDELINKVREILEA